MRKVAPFVTDECIYYAHEYFMRAKRRERTDSFPFLSPFPFSLAHHETVVIINKIPHAGVVSTVGKGNLTKTGR